MRHQNADAEIKSVVRILRGGGGGRRQWRQQNDQEEHTCKQNTCGEYVHDLSEAFHNVRKQFQNGMNFCSGAVVAAFRNRRLREHDTKGAADMASKSGQTG